jgi:hypothetical protein
LLPKLHNSLPLGPLSLCLRLNLEVSYSLARWPCRLVDDYEDWISQCMQALRLILVAVFRQLKIKPRRKFAELRNTGQQSNLATMY